MRIGEVLGLEIDKHFANNFSTVLVRQKARKCKMENYLKTDNAYRDIDLHSSVVKILKEFIGSRRQASCSSETTEDFLCLSQNAVARFGSSGLSLLGAPEKWGRKRRHFHVLLIC
jgi:hypothetical protein